MWKSKKKLDGVYKINSVLYFSFFFSYIKFYNYSYSNTQRLMFLSHAWSAWKGFLM